jgi:hypothetical protein
MEEQAVLAERVLQVWFGPATKPSRDIEMLTVIWLMVLRRLGIFGDWKARDSWAGSVPGV